MQVKVLRPVGWIESREFWESMTDWIFQANPRFYDVHTAVGKSRRDRWSTPRYRDRIAVHDRIWLQIVGPAFEYHHAMVGKAAKIVAAELAKF